MLALLALGFGASAAHADAPGYKYMDWGPALTIDPPDAPLPQTNAFQAISCPDTTFCAAVDNAGQVVTIEDPLSDASTPTSMVSSLTALSGGADLTDVACATSGFCIATTDSTALWWSTNPTGGASTWHSVTLTATAPLTTATCLSATLCLVADSAGHLLTSTNPTGNAAAWSSATVDAGSYITAISCPASNYCLAGDHAGRALISTDPGTSTWTAPQQVTFGGDSFSWVSCPSTAECFAGSRQGAWKAIDVGHGPTQPYWDSHGEMKLETLSCPAADSCLGIQGDGQTYTSHGTTSTWGIFDEIGWTPAFQGDFGGDIDCISDGVCVAVDRFGRLAVSKWQAPAFLTFDDGEPKLYPQANPNELYCAFEAIREDTATHTWLRDGIAIPGATTSTYTTTAADEGHQLSCRVTLTNPAGTISADSAKRAIGTLPTPTPQPTSTPAPAPTQAPSSSPAATPTVVSPTPTPTPTAATKPFPGPQSLSLKSFKKKGLTILWDGLKPGSRATLEVRQGKRLIGKAKANASAAGVARLRVTVSNKLSARLKRGAGLKLLVTAISTEGTVVSRAGSLRLT